MNTETHTLRMRAPDDWHVHLREGDMLTTTVQHTAKRFARAGVMPNLRDPVKSPAQALAYLVDINAHTPKGSHFTPMLSLYLCDNSKADWVEQLKTHPQLLAFKYYPAGATTHAAQGVSKAERIYPILEAMEQHDVPLQIHGEVTDPNVDIFDREARFIEEVLAPICNRFANLRVILEHITTKDAVDFVASHKGPVAATITPHHLLLNRNDLLVGGIHPHHYCLPILKRNTHQQALIKAATSGKPCFFLGSDSAPHAQHRKESACGCAGIYSAHAGIELYAEAFDKAGKIDKLEDFASTFGAAFYQLPRNNTHITLQKTPWQVPDSIPAGKHQIIPCYAGRTLHWSLA